MLRTLREMRENLLEILYLDSPRPAILLISAMTVALGVLFTARGEFFGLSPAYTYMSRFGTENQWGVFCIAAGLFKACVCLLTSRFFRSPHLAVRLFPPVLNGLLMAVWLMLFIGVMMYDPGNAYGTIYGIFTAGTFWTGLRRLRQALATPGGAVPGRG